MRRVQAQSAQAHGAIAPGSLAPGRGAHRAQTQRKAQADILLYIHDLWIVMARAYAYVA